MAQEGLRARKHERTRRAIVDAALRLFARRGFAGTPVEAIAAEAEVALRTFYRYFPSKEDVLFRDTAAEATLRRVLGERRPGESDARLAARAMYEALAGDETRVVRVSAILAATPALHGHAHAMVTQSARLVAARLARGARTREARLRAQLVAESVTGLVRTAYFAWLAGGRRGSAWAQCEKALALLRDGLAD